MSRSRPTPNPQSDNGSGAPDTILVPRERFAASRVLVVGDVMLDRYWFGDVNRISPEAPVPVVHVQRQEDRLGGAANVARNAAALGAHAGLLCVVGSDEPGERIVELLGDSGVHAYLERDPALATTIKLRVLSRQQQLLRVDFENTPAHEVLLAGLARFDALLPSYGVVLMSDYAKGGLTHVTQMISKARAAGRAVLVDPKGDDWARYRGATVITPNRAELREVVGTWKSDDDLLARVTKLRDELRFDALLLTRSEEGMTLFTDDGVRHEPAVAREVYDVSGAGDTVIATLAVALGAGLPLAHGVALANCAAGIVVGKLGTATVDYDELFH
ncbi:D-glycero-beta-D-manno-heptose-7-phosphate kinase [Paraburkholderia caballeronis]|uniref:RfaE bifunctional protein, domain I n=1 Tax=Paraburkholderia caballeronis TaxID=416943 RepID=A0A1H7UPZ4_9BURK|nr:D-glycero-beta-D-manno-heptose-7-phosphate kinase [Paraburkholderia caballeronis]PXW26630.1 D-alpha,beta-D-heptose 7-phosphate 1-kinase [Paraburkholderia caballeronis]PXX02176.1 D-alpha,beta-D-heptose 7-phosphate 1-kinase [Paraburkholderia caballeronis]RAK01333.1 D-alpha,beta-D-heptose 7-phosphate 1-kinase [Paraburkholderia caballeronis]SEB84681.1 D-alpha,beta-D-heptose 7-phosphate 1-kinase [Paraburkholderia caballeronis]SEL99023.1 rfaE bifunctional protein, domain I [Paraburkholderia cabal